MTNFVLIPQRVDGKDEDILINPATIERIVPNSYNENQVIIVFTTGVAIHVSLSLTQIAYYLNSQND